MQDNNQYEESALDGLIEELPDHFPGAVDIIKNDIAPHLIDCNPGVKDHYIKAIDRYNNTLLRLMINKIGCSILGGHFYAKWYTNEMGNAAG